MWIAPGPSLPDRGNVHVLIACVYFVHSCMRCVCREQEERDERHRLKRTLQDEAKRIGATPPELRKIIASRLSAFSFSC